jgi:hypothetical protein
MDSRAGYYEQIFPELVYMDNIFCLSDNALFICNVNYFYTLNQFRKNLIEETPRELSIQKNSSRDILKVENSADMFIYVHTTRDPDHNDLEKTVTTLFKYNRRIREISPICKFPILVNENTLIGVNENNWLIQCSLSGDFSKFIFESDNEINGFYDIKDNDFLLLDKKNILSLCHLHESEFVKDKEVKDFSNIQAVQSYDSDHFVCSILDDQSDEMSFIKDCITRLQLWNKKSLQCIHEFVIKGALINKLKRLPDSQFLSDTMIGCDRTNIVIINFKEKHISIIDMGNLISDFIISETGNLSILGYLKAVDEMEERFVVQSAIHDSIKNLTFSESIKKHSFNPI